MDARDWQPKEGRDREGDDELVWMAAAWANRPSGVDFRKQPIWRLPKRHDRVLPILEGDVPETAVVPVWEFRAVSHTNRTEVFGRSTDSDDWYFVVTGPPLSRWPPSPPQG